MTSRTASVLPALALGPGDRRRRPGGRAHHQRRVRVRVRGLDPGQSARERRDLLRSDRDGQPGERAGGPGAAPGPARGHDRRGGAGVARAVPGVRGAGGGPAGDRAVLALHREPGDGVHDAGDAGLLDAGAEPAGPRGPDVGDGRPVRRGRGGRVPEPVPDRGGVAAGDGYNPFTVDITAVLAAHAGQTVRLRFAETDNVNIFNFGADGVSVNVVPAPALGLGGAAAAAGCAPAARPAAVREATERVARSSGRTRPKIAAR